MTLYHSKPVTIEAWQVPLEGDLWKFAKQVFVDSPVLIEWMSSGTALKAPFWWSDDETIKFWCQKSIAHVSVSRGEYIIAEKDGSGYYPCSADDFAERYDEI